MIRISRGSEAAFAELVRRYTRPVLRFACGYLGEESWSEDVVQETFLSVLRAAGRYEPRAKFTTWLLGIAKNHALKELRKQRRLKRSSLSKSLNPRDVPAAAEPLDRGERAPHETLEEVESHEAMKQALAKLPDEQRLTIVLHFQAELPCTEIAEQLACPVKTVYSRMYAGLTKLREMLSYT